MTFAHAHLQQAGLRFPEQPHYFAIGRSTALALHTVTGIDVRYPLDRETSEVLLQLPELQNVQGKQALILRGNGGREVLAETLAARGAEVEFCECYQRSAKFYNGAEEAMRWHTRGVTTLVVTSGEMMQQLFSLIPPGIGKIGYFAAAYWWLANVWRTSPGNWAGRIFRSPTLQTTMRCFAHYNNSS